MFGPCFLSFPLHLKTQSSSGQSQREAFQSFVSMWDLSLEATEGIDFSPRMIMDSVLLALKKKKE